METAHRIGPTGKTYRRRMWLGVMLLVAGLCGHLLAAHDVGGSRLAYGHHIFGFVIIAVVSGAVIVGLASRYWRGRHDITLLVLGAVQALAGFAVYLGRYRV